MKHTPGPWTFTPADEIDDWTLHDSQFTFIKQDDSGVPVSDADGFLIAAAPDLFDVVKEFVFLSEAFRHKEYDPGSFTVEALITKAKAALAKATRSEEIAKND